MSKASMIETLFPMIGCQSFHDWKSIPWLEVEASMIENLSHDWMSKHPWLKLYFPWLDVKASMIENPSHDWMSKLPWLKQFTPWLDVKASMIEILHPMMFSRVCVSKCPQFTISPPDFPDPPPTPSSWSCYAKYADPPHLPLSGPHVLVGMRVRTWPRYCIILYYVYSLPEKLFFAPGQGGEGGGGICRQNGSEINWTRTQ